MPSIVHSVGLLLGVSLLAALPASAARRPARPARTLTVRAPHYHLVRSIPLAGSLGWDYLTLDSVNRRLYVTRSTHVDVFDADTGLVVGQITQTNGVHGVALAPEMGRGFTSNGADDSVTVFDLRTLSPLARIAVGARPDCIVYDPATRRVFTFNGGSDDATAIDAASGRVLGTVPLGGRPEFAVPDGRGMIYDNLEDQSQVAALDARALTVKHHWPLAPVEGPSGIALDTLRRRLFSTGDNGKMAVLDADTGRLLATPAIGSGPDAAAFDPFYGVALSPNGRDGTLTVVQERNSPASASFPVQATVPTQVGARTMALDARTRHVFLIAAQYAPRPAGAGPDIRPVILDGSVVLLEFAP